MTLSTERQQEMDYLAAKLSDLMKASRGPAESRGATFLQWAQFAVTGIVATILAAYGLIIQQHQQTQDELLKEQQQHVQEQETQASKAKVILDFMPALADSQDAPKAKIALQAIEKFIDIDFAKNVTLIVNSPALKEGLTSIQDTIQAKLVPVPTTAVAAAPAAQVTGWVYLGNYTSGAWTSRYFNNENQAGLQTPQELAAGKPTIGVRAETGAVNLRPQPPSSGTRLTPTAVVSEIRARDKLKIQEVQAVPGTTFWWAHVTKVQ